MGGDIYSNGPVGLVWGEGEQPLLEIDRAVLTDLAATRVYEEITEAVGVPFEYYEITHLVADQLPLLAEVCDRAAGDLIARGDLEPGDARAAASVLQALAAVVRSHHAADPPTGMMFDL